MGVSVDGGEPVPDVHYVRVYRKIAAADSWPQFFVLYMDGNLRLKPQPPVGVNDVCFGSSVIVGPAPIEVRPIAEIESVQYHSASKTLDVGYKEGSSAVLTLQDVDRSLARVRVTLSSPISTVPFTTFMSMFVADGNADADYVMWEDAFGVAHDEPIMMFAGCAGSDWLFYHQTRSDHNTSAPDIRVKVNNPPMLNAIVLQR